jgi:lysophospholipase L1-like esterase
MVQFRLLAPALVPALLLALPVQAAEPYLPPLKLGPQAEQRLRSDWPWLTRYQAANAALPPKGKEPRVVFIGDSITQGWAEAAPDFFVAGRIGRGIAGQTTPQILLRFRQDVIDLHPTVVQIQGGANDIAANTGPMTFEQTQANIRTMVELAQAHGVRVILASVPPSTRLPWRPQLTDVAERIHTLNAWLRRYADESGAVYADYWSVLQNGQGGIRPSWSTDGAHPNRTGYAAMAQVAQQAIAQALARPAPRALPVTLQP